MRPPEGSGRRPSPPHGASSRSSDTPLAQKLGIKPDQIVHLVGAPRGWSVPEPPDGAEVRRRGLGSAAHGGTAAVVVTFCRSATDLERKASAEAMALAPTSALWIAWPRRAGDHRSDITDSLVRETLLPIGVVDVKVAALDDDWSGLKFVWRMDRRPSPG